MQYKELSVIVPVQESSQSFPVALLDIDNYLSKKAGTYEIIVSGLKDSVKLLEFKKKIGSAIENIKFVSSESGDIVSLSKAGISTAVGDAVLWASSEHLFDSTAAHEAISKIHTKATAKSDVVFVSAKASNSGEIISEKLVNLFSPVSSQEVSLIAIDMHEAQKICGAVNVRANFAIDLAMIAQKTGAKIGELKRDVKSILPVDRRSSVLVLLSVIFARARFEVHWMREGQGVEVRV